MRSLYYIGATDILYLIEYYNISYFFFVFRDTYLVEARTSNLTKCTFPPFDLTQLCKWEWNTTTAAGHIHITLSNPREHYSGLVTGHNIDSDCPLLIILYNNRLLLVEGHNKRKG